MRVLEPRPNPPDSTLIAARIVALAGNPQDIAVMFLWSAEATDRALQGPAR